jgi:hypothetical protein
MSDNVKFFVSKFVPKAFHYKYLIINVFSALEVRNVSKSVAINVLTNVLWKFVTILPRI